ncbi:hypothetical protein IU486_33270 [Streptomyces gardneri]|uniref:hypothetical protein n=1 Tax=Nocardia TaxID=1817 RepID=UPI001356C185|nr:MULTISPECIES: hypothetical protein [Nocardia]MBF6169554.1 hypothetical protein [Streptomyces gardneri]
MTTLPDQVLENHLRHYAAFAEADRTRILAAVIKNYGRSVDNSDLDRNTQWRAAVQDLTTSPLTAELVESTARLLSNRSANTRPKFRAQSFLADIGAAVQQVPSSAEQQLGLALDMHEQGIAPVLTYAFNQWVTTGVEPKAVGRCLAELTVMGLYRLANAHEAATDATLLASGSTAAVIRTRERVHKHPRNYAAREVLLPLEFTNYQILAKTCLHDRIPANADFDPTTKILHHDYVPGRDGEAILRSGLLPNPQQETDLKHLHSALLRELREHSLVLDLHPGNYVWNAARDRWVLVDIGPIPLIGSEEYFIEDFSAYYTHTWLNRLTRERAEPVRSIDYSVGPLIDPPANAGSSAR